MKPKVTIGICVRNCADYIQEAITSIVAQDFPHGLMELIVVDGYSEDKTLAIIKENLDKTDLRYRVFYENEGVGRARQIVVDNACGKYIVWVDGDMLLTKDFVRKQVEFMDNNPDAGIAKGKCGIYDISSLVAYLENVGALVKLLDERKLSSEVLGTAGCIYRVKVVRKIGGFDAKLKSGEDEDAEDRIRKAGWSLNVSSAEHFELRRLTWRALWNEYFWHGFGGHQIFSKVNPHSLLYRMFPPASILTEVSRSISAYKLSHKKVVFLLPFHWIFKRIAWCFGFARCYFKNSRMA